MTKGLLKGGILRLKRYLKENKIDILVACGALYFPVSVLSCKMNRTRCYCWEHSNLQNKKDHPFQTLCRTLGAKNADKLITLTKVDKENYIKRYKISNVFQIYNPIDEKILKSVAEYKEDSKRIISVGRLSYVKNYGTMIEIAKDVLSMNPDWIWDIYGDGELRNELEIQIKRYGLEEKVNLKGQIKDMYNLYSEYSILVMTSYYEGFPMSLLEGMAFGIPLISFDVPTGPNEIIINGENGYLIKPFDIKEIVFKIDYLINNKSKRKEMSLTGKERIKYFRKNDSANKWKELFDNEFSKS